MEKMRIASKESTIEESNFAKALSDFAIPPIDPSQKQPLYEQAANRIKLSIAQKIAEENLTDPEVDIPIETVRSLSERLSVHTSVIQKALKKLETEGYIFAIVGRGYFIVPSALKKDDKRARRAIEKIYDAFMDFFIMGLTEESIKNILTDIFKFKSVEHIINNTFNDDEERMQEILNILESNPSLQSKLLAHLGQ